MKKKLLFFNVILLSSLFTFSNSFFLENKEFSKSQKTIENSNEEIYNSKTFSEYIKANETEGNVNVTIEKDIDLSDFKDSSLNQSTFSNDYAIHGYKDVTINFNGHNVFNKTYQPLFSKKSGEFTENNQKIISQVKYDKDNGVANTPRISFYYLYWFYDIDNLTLENANFINVPFLAYDIEHLTITDSSFSNTNVSNLYWGSVLNHSPQPDLNEQEKFIGVVADQINNVDFSNLAFSNYYIGQNIYNYDSIKKTGQTTIALFSRLGNDENSKLNFDNLAFYNIEFSLNERGIQVNQDVSMNFGIFQNLIGSSNFNNIYFDEIKFISNNDTNIKGNRQNSLISFDQEPINITVNNIFVGRVFTSTVFLSEETKLVNSTWIMTMSFIYSDMHDFSKRLNYGKVSGKVDKSKITFVKYSEDKEKEELFNAGLSSKNKINYFVESSEEGYNSISFEKATSSSFFNKNFNNEFYFLNSGELPEPIILPITEGAKLTNKWSKIKFEGRLKPGFVRINDNLKVLIELDRMESSETANADTLVVISQEEYSFNEKIDFKYKKPKKTRLQQYYLKVSLKQGNNIIPLNNPVALEITPVPSYLYPTIITAIVLIILIILIIIILFITFMVKKGKVATAENSELSERFNQYHYDFDEIDEFYATLSLPKTATHAKLQKVYNKKLKEFLKGNISREEFDHIHTSYLAISSYIDSEQYAYEEEGEY